METIRRSDQIYAWANEYHVMGFGTFKRGWCLMELGVTNAPPIIYSGHNGFTCDDYMEVHNTLVQYNHRLDGSTGSALQELLCYENAGFTKEDDREIVQGFIESARGDVENFEAFLVEKVLGLKHQILGEFWFIDGVSGRRG